VIALARGLLVERIMFEGLTFGSGQSPMEIPRAGDDEIVVIFTAYHIHTQTYNGIEIDQNYLFASVFYDLVVKGDTFPGLETAVKQGYQADYETDPIEMTTPSIGDYNGPFPIGEFDDAVIAYLRSCFGEQGEVISVNRGWESGLINCRIERTSDPVILKIPRANEPCGGWLLGDITRLRKPHTTPASGTTPLGEVRDAQAPLTSPAQRLDRND
jgi:hypothetical protein